MANNCFPILELKGTPFEKGYEHGLKAAAQIEISIDTYKDMFNEFASLSWEEALIKAMDYLPYIESYAFELVEEMKGIADGAGKTFAEILALNVRSELVLNNNKDGCTSIFSLDDKSVYLGQNWDWKKNQKEALVVLKILDAEKPNILMITEGGIVGKLGLNERGLGVCMNALASSGSGLGVPVHIILRQILESLNLGDAVEVVDKAKIAAAANYLIASGEGEGVDIEASPLNYHVLIRDKNYMTHTNHFISPLLANFDLGKSLFPDTFVRLSRANSLMREESQVSTFSKLQTIFKDHMNYPDAICRHEDTNDPQSKRMETIFSLIMDLKKQHMYISRGQPCINEYHKITFKTV